MRLNKAIAFVLGCLMVLPGLALLAGGGLLGLSLVVGRDDDGFVTTSLETLSTTTAAVVTTDATIVVDQDVPRWLVETIGADLRLTARATDGAGVFVGIAPTADVEDYFEGVAHDVVVDADRREATYERRDGREDVPVPVDQGIWVATAAGDGEQTLDWAVEQGSWTVVLMRPDAAPGIDADVDVGARSDLAVPIAVGMLVLGSALVGLGVVVLVVSSGRVAKLDTAPVDPTSRRAGAHPLALTADLDDDLSRWTWLVKWLLAIPHVVVLAFLTPAFVVLTVVAGVAILFTGRYPRGPFELNVGILRWTWRVAHYATTGGIGTDRYPPFTLRALPDDAASLDVRYPERLNRWGPLVKWLLALPHLLVVGLLVGSGLRWTLEDGTSVDLLGGGLLSVLVVVAGVMLLFTGRYPRALFDLVVGLNRWVYRTVAYVALMTDIYPPFRLDQGGQEPAAPQPPSPPTPATAPVDLADDERPTAAGRRPAAIGGGGRS